MSAKKDKKNVKKKKQKAAKPKTQKTALKVDRKASAPVAKPAALGKPSKASKASSKEAKKTKVKDHKAAGKPARVSAKELASVLAPGRAEEEVVLTNADGKKYCKSPDCDAVSTTAGY